MVVWNIWIIFPFSWEFHDPNWLSLHHFSEGQVHHQPASQFLVHKLGPWPSKVAKPKFPGKASAVLASGWLPLGSFRPTWPQAAVCWDEMVRRWGFSPGSLKIPNSDTQQMVRLFFKLAMWMWGRASQISRKRWMIWGPDNLRAQPEYRPYAYWFATLTHVLLEFSV